MRNVLVTGGTGFIGVELVKRLAEAGLRPRVLVRRPHRAALLAAHEVDLVQGDLDSEASLRRALAGVDTVYHLGGRASFESYARLRPTIVDGTARLARLAVEAGVEHFTFASSLFVYGDQTAPIAPGSEPRPKIDYGRAKLDAEGLLEQIAAPAGMGVASLRLPHVYGPQSILFDQVRRGLVLFPGGMANRCGQLHVEDAVSILVAVGERRWVGASAVADDDSMTWAEFFQILAALYPRFRMVNLPQWMGIAGGAVLEPLLSRRGRPTLYTKDTVVGFNLNVPVAPRLIWADVDLAPAYPSAHTGIAAALDGYVRYRWRHPLLDQRSR